MKSILISIQPQWVEKILNGEKTIEIRKTAPKCEFPCKVYIYCTQARLPYQAPNCVRADYLSNPYSHRTPKKYILGANYDECLNGKVVAEFTLNNVDFIKMPANITNTLQEKSCVNGYQLMKYLGGEYFKSFYAWHIDNLKIYDKPKELREFRKDIDCDDYPCNKNRDCKYNYYDTSEGCWACGIDFDGTNCIYKQIKRPPQSWCYVEEL